MSSLSSIKPVFPSPSDPTTTLATESPPLRALIDTLHLRPHIEGGYFVETDRDPRRIPNPFLPHATTSSISTPIPAPAPAQPEPKSATHRLQSALESATATNHGNATSGPGRDEALPGGDDDAAPLRQQYNREAATRSASTSILYLLTPASPQGYLHRNHARQIHSVIRGRGRYVVVHPPVPAADEEAGAEVRARRGEGWVSLGEGRGWVESFAVGTDVLAGERVQWVVEGGCWKGSFLVGVDGGGEGRGEEGLLVSETVVPGFEYEDHEFLDEGKAMEVLGEEGMRELGWLVRRH